MQLLRTNDYIPRMKTGRKKLSGVLIVFPTHYPLKYNKRFPI